MSSLFSIEKKTIILTGGSRGIGAALTQGLVDAGANVYVFSKWKIEEPVTGATYHMVDLTDFPKVKELVTEIIQKEKTIHGLVNNAGIGMSFPSESYPWDAWEQTISLNLNSAFYLAQCIFPAMKENGGSIINITSLAASLGLPKNPAYHAAKGGLRSLSKALATDWGEYNIRVNNIAPGYILTDLTRKSHDDPQLHKDRLNRMILQRWGQPKDLLGPVIFLLSDASSYVTGLDLCVDGGWTAKGL